MKDIIDKGGKVKGSHFLSAILQEYELVELVGQGSFSVVTRAKKEGKDYAIKFISDIFSNELMVRSFIREITILR